MIEANNSSASSLRDQILYLELLRNAARQLNSTLDLDSLLEQIVTEVALAFGCSRSAVLLINEDRNELELVAVHDWAKGIQRDFASLSDVMP